MTINMASGYRYFNFNKVLEEFNFESMVDEHYKINDKKFMSNFLRLDLKDVLGAVVSSALVALLGYILMVGDVFVLDLRIVANIAVMAGAGSLLKSLLTNSEGKFISFLPVK